MAAAVVIDSLEDALEEAMKTTSLKTDHIIILATDNGPAMLAKQPAQYIDMSAYYHIRGRSHHPQTTGMVERLIRTIKEEELYVHGYLDPLVAQRKPDKWRYTYNHERPHQALGYKTHFEVYTSSATKSVPGSVKIDPKWYTSR